MKIGTIIITAGILALGLATWTPGNAQGPLYDRVNVSLPYSVTIGERTLQPGDYVIQQLRDSGGGSRVLLIYSDSGMKFETSAMTIPALDNRTPEDTKVVLHHVGNDYYFDKVWIQGKDYGYQFPLPDAVKARERERAEPMSVAAKYSTVEQTESSSTAATTNTAETATAQPTTTATTATTTQSTTQREQPVEAAQAPTTSAPATMQPATTQSATTQSDTTQSATTQSATTEPATAQSATTQSRTAQSATTQPTTTGAADRTMTESADRSMPDTAAGWLMMLLGGGALSGAGLALRRKR